MGRPIRPLADRLMDAIIKTDTCWLWTKGVDKNEYGKIRDNPPTKRHFRAHRVSYELHKGAIPEGMFVCHTCDNPRCIYPEHLFLGTAFDNNRDTIAKGRRNNPKGKNHWTRRQKQVRDDRGKFIKIK